MVYAFVIVINSVIGGFSWVDLVWLATSTVKLQVSDYNCIEWLVKNKAANAPIRIEEFVMVMINEEKDKHSSKERMPA